ncbi:AzlC family ABC transporter permease [Mesobacterium pallidum]|uniref:AzlC family ABC transporter permease n=1 Tax=Mesobacterium pallidum TaxID=2872037 RepID=UPI001EE185C4|nr:AzlC family ABC transporter permease [Mesobacterium pallidum]
MARSANLSSFRKGAMAGLAFGLIVSPFGVVFGVLATEAGLDVTQVLSFSLAVIAGAAQLTAIQLMVEEAPTIIILASALAVNLRLAMYSATLVQHLGDAPLWHRVFCSYLLTDQSFAMSLDRYERHPELTMGEKLAFYYGVAVPTAMIWYVSSLAGGLIGSSLPSGYGLDFAIPITFLALVTPMVRTLNHLAAAGAAIVVALLLAGLPYNLGLLVAGLVGMMTGAQVEKMRSGDTA